MDYPTNDAVLFAVKINQVSIIGYENVPTHSLGETCIHYQHH